MNCYAPASNPADCILYGYRQCLRPKWENKSPQIRINKGPATDPLDVIILKSTIHGSPVNSYFTQRQTVKICLLRKLSSCVL